MANVSIKFNGKDFLLSCDDGQEEALKTVTSYLDKKYKELKDKLGNIGENKLLLITTIQLIDEYFDLKRRITQQKKKLDDLASKFKELKKSYARGSELSGKTLGIIGFGRIGQEVAKIAIGVGMKVIFYDKFNDQANIKLDFFDGQNLSFKLKSS